MEFTAIRDLYENNNLAGKKWRYRSKNEKPEWIVVHYVGMTETQGNADRAARSIIRSSREASTHYVVGSDKIINILPIKLAAYHVGGNDENKKIDCYNGNSIGVDLCERKENADEKSVECDDWYFDDKTLSHAALFIASLAIKAGIPLDRIVRHYDVTGKMCPRPFVGEDINAHTGKTHDQSWFEFKNAIARHMNKG